MDFTPYMTEVLLLELTAWPEPPTIQHLFSADWNDEGHVPSEGQCETDRDLRKKARSSAQIVIVCRTITFTNMGH